MEITAVDRLEIRLAVNRETLLMILLTEGGSVNRLNMSEEGIPVFSMGRTEATWFQEVMALFTPEMMELSGRYEYPDPQGDPCELVITLSSGEEETGFAFLYGSESVGPPEEMIQVVELATDLTEAWFEEQQAKGAKKSNK